MRLIFGIGLATALLGGCAAPSQPPYAYYPPPGGALPLNAGPRPYPVPTAPPYAQPDYGLQYQQYPGQPSAPIDLAPDSPYATAPLASEPAPLDGQPGLAAPADLAPLPDMDAEAPVTETQAPAAPPVVTKAPIRNESSVPLMGFRPMRGQSAP